MGIKSREPDELKHSDYVSWYLEFLDIRGRFIASGEWPMHLDVDFAALHTAFTNAYADYEAKLQHMVKTATPAHNDAAKKVYLRIRSFKQLLPTLFGGDDAVLTEFGINVQVPSDKDDLYIMAKNCIDYWTEITDPVVPPEYAPVEAFFTTFSTEFGDFEAAHEAHIDATREKEIAETLVDTTREPCHRAERLIFKWFRGIHLDPQEKWWEDTMWGTTSGGGGGEEPQPGSWEDAPTNFEVREGLPGSAVLTADIHPDAEGCAVFMAEGDLGVAEPPMRPGEPVAPLITPLDPGKFSYNLNIPANRRVWFWICHVKNGAWGAMAGPKWIEVVK